jgi:hypothetical protein
VHHAAPLQFHFNIKAGTEGLNIVQNEENAAVLRAQMKNLEAENR